MKENKIKVTFIMMAYNTERYIEKSVRSVLNQTEQNVVLCVRNNGSTDRTGEILRKLQSEDSRIFLVENKVNGVTDEGGGLFGEDWWPLPEDKTGEYISIIDSDDYLEPNFTEVLYKEAKLYDADITAAGNWFVAEKTRYGQRVPERIVADSMQEIKDSFPSIYNCFRTWWGKLFKAGFFKENYAKAWRWHHPMHWMMDTLIMINYLGMCQKLVTISMPLYNMLVRENSTYQKRPFDHGILWAAYALYNNNISFLKNNSIDTQENVRFVSSLHWTYIMEGIQVFQNNRQISAREKLRHIKIILNDSIVRDYMPWMFERMYGELMPYLKEIEEQGKEDLFIYKSYIMRLKCFFDSAEENETNPLNYPLLMGALFDSENRNYFGLNLISLSIQGGSFGVRNHLNMGEEAWMYWAENPSCFVNTYCNYYDRTPDIKEAEQNLKTLWEDGQYEECYTLMDKISTRANFSREAMYYRILLLRLFDQHEMAVIVAYTAESIFKYDLEMVQMCDQVIRERVKNVQ